MAGIVVSCEHATAWVPSEIDLGIVPELLHTHIAWDPGALPVAEALAHRCRAPLFRGRVSRLVCDVHRREGHPEVMRVDAWGVRVPGNEGLSPEAVEARLRSFHRPFRRALHASVDEAISARGRCLHLSIHSFDPGLSSGERDLDVGVLFRPERALCAAVGAALLDALRAAGFDARVNQPYDGYGEATTTWLEESRPDLRYVGIEIELSQALDADAGGRVAQALGTRLLSISSDRPPGP